MPLSIATSCAPCRRFARGSAARAQTEHVRLVLVVRPVERVGLAQRVGIAVGGATLRARWFSEFLLRAAQRLRRRRAQKAGGVGQGAQLAHRGERLVKGDRLGQSTDRVHWHSPLRVCHAQVGEAAQAGDGVFLGSGEEGAVEELGRQLGPMCCRQLMPDAE